MQSYFDYTAKEVARGLKRFLGRQDVYGVRWLFLDRDTVLVRFEGEWRPVWFSQVRIYMPCERSRRA